MEAKKLEDQAACKNTRQAALQLLLTALQLLEQIPGINESDQLEQPRPAPTPAPRPAPTPAPRPTPTPAPTPEEGRTNVMDNGLTLSNIHFMDVRKSKKNKFYKIKKRRVTVGTTFSCFPYRHAVSWSKKVNGKWDERGCLFFNKMKCEQEDDTVVIEELDTKTPKPKRFFRFNNSTDATNFMKLYRDSDSLYH